MVATRPIPDRRKLAGTTMIEVLVTIVILSIGLLGLAGAQSRLQLSEMESYQRTQALILLNDMASRISTNRHAAPDYLSDATTPWVGAGMSCPTVTSSSTRQQIDSAHWCNALQGAAEIEGLDALARRGAVIGGRGCIERISTSNDYLVTVAWQGLTPISAPPTDVACGADSAGTNPYNGAAGSPCTNDRCRRVVTTIVRIANLN